MIDQSAHAINAISTALSTNDAIRMAMSMAAEWAMNLVAELCW